jgi:hypothetical protein
VPLLLLPRTRNVSVLIVSFISNLIQCEFFVADPKVASPQDDDDDDEDEDEEIEDGEEEEEEDEEDEDEEDEEDDTDEDGEDGVGQMRLKKRRGAAQVTYFAFYTSQMYRPLYPVL